MEFDHNKSVIVGKFDILDSKWGRFFNDMTNIKEDLEKKGNEVLFWNTQTKDFGTLKASAIKKAKFTKPKFSQIVKNTAWLS